MIPKDLLLYIDVGLSAKKATPIFPISDQEAIRMAVNMDYKLTYGKTWKEYNAGTLLERYTKPKREQIEINNMKIVYHELWIKNNKQQIEVYKERITRLELFNEAYEQTIKELRDIK